MSDQIAPIKAKIERAYKHILDLHAAVDTFQQRKPYIQSEEIEPRTGDYVTKLRVVHECPAPLLAIVGDALHNLRATLDYVWNALVVANHRTPNEQTQFQIYKSRQSHDSARQQRIHEIGGAANTIFEQLQSYSGGNVALDRLNQLNNIDKHRLLLTAAAHNFRIEIGSPVSFQAIYPDITGTTRALGGGHTLKDGVVLLRVTTAEKAKMEMEPQFFFCIALAEVCDGEPLPGVIYGLFAVVEDIAAKFCSLL